MGKKSEAKNKRRSKRKSRVLKSKSSKKTISMENGSEFFNVPNKSDNYINCIDSLVNIFSLHKPEDIVVALCISDIWLPNISSSVKHQLAYRVLGTMNEGDFLEELELNSYEQFSTFIEKVYAVIPNNPMIEDFVPEQDWGDVNFKLNEECYQIFYGGNVERITDFLSAFKICHSNSKEAIEELRIVLQLQNYLIITISPVARRELVSGYVEVPVELFWKQAKCILSSIDSFLNEISIGKDISHLFSSLGDMRKLANDDSIGDLASNGDLFQSFGFKIKDKLYIASPRNISSVLLDLWSKKELVRSSKDFTLIDSFNSYISQRYKANSFVGGPLVLQSPTEIFPYTFTTLVQSNNEYFLLLLSDYNDIECISDVKKLLISFVNKHKRWRFFNLITGGGVELKNSKGEYFPINELKVVVVLKGYSTLGGIIPVVDDDTLLFSMPEFVTVFDSFKDIEELSRFNDYVNVSKKQLFHGFSGMSDVYASFRQSDEVLLAGATQFDYVHLDIFMGSDWRYTNLKQYWDSAPLNFPPGINEWFYEQSSNEGLYSLHSRNFSDFCWSAVVGGCLVHFLFSFDGIENDPINGKLVSDQ